MYISSSQHAFKYSSVKKASVAYFNRILTFIICQTDSWQNACNVLSTSASILSAIITEFIMFIFVLLNWLINNPSLSLKPWSNDKKIISGVFLARITRMTLQRQQPDTHYHGRKTRSRFWDMSGITEKHFCVGIYYLLLLHSTSSSLCVCDGLFFALKRSFL